ncbi:hypothetical protein CLAFUW4_09153 [Fulvia fulva]|nr:hypothetical protein CLAFUR4_09159 [Fulvia fulva]KAK4614884.1 hypothetical protein CLAFUR0_09151 [Fulvia fulva]WPV19873.1 hypothetical protein CLAFUW4_09153 [Fulvia fulva]WPV35740.1 hypothetical protein CLAFUW7_09154 [Fulvia fulva]
MGCKYDALASAWLPPACVDEALSYEFDHAGPQPDGSWVYYTDYDKTGTYTLEEVAMLANTGACYYNTMAWHLAHCTYNWRKAVRSKWTGVTLEYRSDTEEHVSHCEMMFKDRTPLEYVGTVSLVTTNADWQPEVMHPTAMHPSEMHATDMHPEAAHSSDIHPEAVHPEVMHPADMHPKAMHPSEMHPEAMHPADMHPSQMHPNEMHPNEMHPSDMHPSDMHPNDMHPSDMHPNDMHPSAMHPEDMHPSEMHPKAMHPAKMHPTIELE